MTKSTNVKKTYTAEKHTVYNHHTNRIYRSLWNYVHDAFNVYRTQFM